MKIVRDKGYYRHQHQRAVAKAEHLVREIWKYNDEWTEGLIQHLTKNRKPCSCYMCCSPRNMQYGTDKFRLTLQERKDLVNVEEEIVELHNDERFHFWSDKAFYIRDPKYYRGYLSYSYMFNREYNKDEYDYDYQVNIEEEINKRDFLSFTGAEQEN